MSVNQYRVGSIIHIVYMKDEPNYAHKEGVIKHIDDMGTLFGTWGGLGVVPEADDFITVNY